MKIRLSITIVISKLIIKACRLIKLGGTSLPGEIARKIYPGIVTEITKDFNIIMVTGTNGKTTTTRIIGQILTENGIEFICNKSGANLVDGITTTFIQAVDVWGKCISKTALIEIDEAAFDKMTNFVEPDILVVTNFFRDQLDRFGELYTTLKRVKSGIEKSKKTKLILNADDSLCASIGIDTEKEVLYFGMGIDSIENTEEIISSDATFCIYCKAKYNYSYHVYGHLGGFLCPNCGYKQPLATVTCQRVKELTSSYSNITFSIQNPLNPDNNDALYSSKINLPGLYNIYNSLAAVCCGLIMTLPIENTVKALGNFECGFGRMETINAGGKFIKLILVKNPTGFNQVLTYLLTEEKSIQVAFLINDKIADGTDVSWLWDVDFEKLQKIQDKLHRVYASGLRAEDMALRLKYAGIYTNKIESIKDYSYLLDSALEATSDGESFYILPTYTAMLEVRKILKAKFGLKEFWK
jgi:lipid II isoglutaminyl synthase (glutamine-hydrolysing)